MNNMLFSNRFVFRRIHFDTYHYTDHRAGSPMHYIACMWKGHAKIVSKHNTVYVNEGDVFYIPRHLPYQSYWYGKKDVDFISLGFLDVEADVKMNFDLQVVACDDALKKRIAAIPTDGCALSCEALSIFYDVLAKLLPYLRLNPSVSKKDELVDRAKKYIIRNTDCSVAEVAQSCYISEPYLYMLFKEKAGCTPNEYRLKAKCQKGMEYLLSTDKTVEEISAITGFSSASHFRRVLKSHLGLTPKEVRKNSDF